MILNKAQKALAAKLSDQELIDRIIHHGDKHLMELIYDRYSQKVFYKCISLLKDRESAKDLTHDIIVKVLMNLAKFKGNSEFSLWVHAITYNHCMTYLRKRNRFKTTEFETSNYEEVAVDEIEKEHKVLKDLQLDQLEILLEQLRAKDKMILLMRYQDGMSVKLISQSLQIGESAVKMRLKRSRDLLAELMKNLEEHE